MSGALEMYIAGMIARLPPEDSVFTPQQRRRWINAFASILDICYRDNWNDSHPVEPDWTCICVPEAEVRPQSVGEFLRYGIPWAALPDAEA